MRVLPALICALAFLLTGCFGGSSGLKPGSRVPYTKFEILNDDYILLDSLRGKNVGLLFWATTCRNSKAAVRDFNKQAREFTGRKDIVFIAASLDENQDRENLEAFIVKEDLTAVTHAYSGNGAYDEAYMYFGCEFIPQTFLISPDGKVAASGSELNFSELLNK